MRQQRREAASPLCGQRFGKKKTLPFAAVWIPNGSSLTGMNGGLMVQGQKKKKKQRSRRKPFGVMVGWVAVWQAAKKALSHSPYVTCFPSASAVRICYQRRTCRQSRCLKLQSLDDDGFSFLPVTFPIRLPSRVARHTGAMADTGTLMHVDSMDTPTRTHACNNLKKMKKT